MLFLATLSFFLLVAVPSLPAQTPTLSAQADLSPSAQKEIGEKLSLIIQSAGMELEKTHACPSHEMAVVALITKKPKGEPVIEVQIYCKPDKTEEESTVPHT